MGESLSPALLFNRLALYVSEACQHTICCVMGKFNLFVTGDRRRNGRTAVIINDAWCAEKLPAIRSATSFVETTWGKPELGHIASALVENKHLTIVRPTAF